MPAGDFSEKVTFSERAVVSDGGGGVIGEFTDQFTVPAGYTYLRGGEAVLAARLTGVQTVIIKVRQSSSETDRITPSWQARDARDETIFAIKSVAPDKDAPKLNWDILATSGEAA